MAETRNVLLYLIQSLDGYIAESDGTMTWLQQLNTTEADSAFQNFYSRVETVIMGRKTYTRATKRAGSYPYSDKQSFVFTTTMHDTEDRATVVAGDVVEFVRQLKQEKGGDIWLVGGPDLFAKLLKANEIDKLIISIAPVLLGTGTPLLNTNLKDVPLNLIATKKIGRLVELTYAVDHQ
ncbi:dihydrofolate reductase family protein [Loigolactobacillus binensis]|uniref:Dihydrofolate reductase family protein n=1 Tax=Loigolactobacillus binensis TaxID=2559922 RepID=A0ABW3EE05_9LACO|nr:dihydrofolate reductase family protein [Loigolactobacillus binensis]